MVAVVVGALFLGAVVVTLTGVVVGQDVLDDLLPAREAASDEDGDGDEDQVERAGHEVPFIRAWPVCALPPDMETVCTAWVLAHHRTGMLFHNGPAQAGALRTERFLM